MKKTKEIQDTVVLAAEECEQSQLTTASRGFDLESLRLSQDFTEDLGVKKLLLTVPVRKPSKQEFVRVNPDAWFPTFVLEFKEENELYLVDKALWPDMATEITPMGFALTTNRVGVVFLWPLRLPSSDGKTNEWNRTAMAACQKAKTAWVRMISNRSLGAYEVYEAVAEMPDPAWPEASLTELLNTAFKDRFINSADHPMVKRLRGEA